VVLEGGKVFQAAGNKTVDAANLVPCGEQLLREMASQETCAAGNDNPQENPLLVGASLSVN
jgi:hypothetical protein